jgi:TetR/AcrR family transcriptional repressor of nem operon
MVGTLAIARGAARGNPAVSDQVLQASRRVLDELMLADTDEQPPVRTTTRPVAVKSIS